MNTTLRNRIKNHLKNLSVLRKDLEFYEQKKLLINSFENLKIMDSKWDNVFASSSSRIAPMSDYQEYNMEKIVWVKYSPEKNEVILCHKNDSSIKFTYDEFVDFLYFLDTINDGWCDTNFFIGDYLYVSYWHEEESKGMTVGDMRTKEVLGLNENHLELLLAHKYDLYDIFIKME